ncbi:hypothetical protein C7S13_7563 [Burkholderia cepacia]|nr:hypothetical protein [Burkholderia cepacia]
MSASSERVTIVMAMAIRSAPRIRADHADRTARLSRRCLR